MVDEADGNHERPSAAELHMEGDAAENMADPNQMMDTYDGNIHNAADYGDEDEIAINPSAADLNQEELEAIIESISSGKS